MVRKAWRWVWSSAEAHCGGKDPSGLLDLSAWWRHQTASAWRDLTDGVSTGRFDGGIGYILIKSWSKGQGPPAQAALEALKSLADCRGIVIDVRPNAGGSETLALLFAGCFVAEPVLYAKHVNPDPGEPGGFGDVRERILKPNDSGPSYRGPVAVLMGQANMSSCEAFLLMMKQVPNCKLIGQRSYGSSGNPKPTDLGNGVTVWLPSWKALRPDGTCFEGQGIQPDIPVRTGPTRRWRQRDPILTAALKWLARQNGTH